MKFATTALITSLGLLSAASPTPVIDRRAVGDPMCGDWDLITTGPYTLYNNLWGKGAATSGSQCTTLDKVSGSVLSWHSTWSWAGGQYNVKSYPNVVVATQQVPLSKIKSIETTWKWGYTGQNLVTNVAYDVFTSSTPGGAEEYELMVWLGNFNAGPIASAWGADGKPVPLAKGIQLAGITWDLFKGPNGQMTVFSFLPSDGKNIVSFKGDINVFLKYLTQSQGVSANQYLKSVGAGTEPTTGDNAVFTTSKYTVDVKYL